MNVAELNNSQTICALATAAGGPVAIIRISGDMAIAHADKLWQASKSLKEDAPRHLRLGQLMDAQGTVIDTECLGVKMPGPHSYTGEDTVEFQCHGGPLAARLALQALQEVGCRLAAPGEFTKRAFLNGRIDLTQAEAIADIISASSESALTLANKQLCGVLGERLRIHYTCLLDLLSECESHLDFPEEDMDWMPTEELLAKLNAIFEDVKQLSSTAWTGEVLRGSLSVAIAGQPNVGKSSLLNAILGRNRAIVSEIPGTTRDTIEADATIRGIPLRFIDTAGLRTSPDRLEQEGIERSRTTIGEADVVLWVADAAKPLSEQQYDGPALPSGRLIKLANKADKATERDWEDFIPTCAITGDGLEVLYDAIENAVWQGKNSRQSDFAVSARHGQLLKEAASALEQAAGELTCEIWELAAIQMRSALQSIGQITGQAIEPDVLGEIFAKFCIGK